MTGSVLLTPVLAASETTSSPGFILPALIATPLLGAVLIALIPRSRSDLFKPIALLTSIAAAAMSLYMLSAFEGSDPGYQFVVDHTWISRLGISFHLGVDGISLFLIVLTGIMFPIAILGAKIDHDQKAYYGWLMVLMAGSMGVFSALDLVLFFAFFEIVLVPMYFLIGLWGHGQRI